MFDLDEVCQKILRCKKLQNDITLSYARGRYNNFGELINFY